MKPIGRSRLRRAEFTVVVAAVLFLGAVGLASALVGIGDVASRLAAVSLPVLAGLLGLSLANYLLRIGRWQLFSRRVGVRLPLRRTALVFFAGFAMTPTPGKLGEALRLWLIERMHGYRYARTLPIMIGDKIGDSAAVLILCLFGVGAFGGYAVATLVAGGALVLLALLFARPRLLIGLIDGAYARIGRWPRLFAGLRHMARQTARLFSPPLLAVALAIGVVGWFAECLALYWLVDVLGGSISLRAAIFVFAFSMVVGAVSMMPGGLGGTEVTMFALLTAAGVGPDAALAATAVIRATTLWFSVALGGAALPFALRAARAGTAEAAGARA